MKSATLLSVFISAGMAAAGVLHVTENRITIEKRYTPGCAANNAMRKAIRLQTDENYCSSFAGDPNSYSIHSDFSTTARATVSSACSCALANLPVPTAPTYVNNFETDAEFVAVAGRVDFSDTYPEDESNFAAYGVHRTPNIDGQGGSSGYYRGNFAFGDKSIIYRLEFGSTKKWTLPANKYYQFSFWHKQFISDDAGYQTPVCSIDVVSLVDGLSFDGTFDQAVLGAPNDFITFINIEQDPAVGTEIPMTANWVQKTFERFAVGPASVDIQFHFVINCWCPGDIPGDACSSIGTISAAIDTIKLEPVDRP